VFFRKALGEQFVDYYVHIKNAEIDRFQAEVSDWEQREYFEMF
jgi:glutamine synthetase